MRVFLADKSGFSLVWLCAMLAVAGVALAAVLPGGKAGNDEAKHAVTMQRMQKIEEATRAFMAYNLRRPCPADGTLIQNDPTGAFGLEALNPGVCKGLSVISANFTDGTSVPSIVAGMVPTKTLNLPDEYALDGYGRRMMYVVDRNATSPLTCHDMQSHNVSGALPIMSSSTSTAAVDYTMWALVSYGKNGQGAFPEQGSSTANRIDYGNPSADVQINAFAATGAMNMTIFTGKLVQHDPVIGGTNSFDDTVWYLSSSKNTCALGEAANNGFRISGADSSDPSTGITVATGDINGDGIPDLVIGVQDANSSQGTIYVIFGSPYGWPQGGLSPATPFNLNSITGVASTISTVIAANPALVSSALVPGGAPVYITGVSGMPQINNRCYKTSAAGSWFALQDMNGNNISASDFLPGSGGYAMLGCGAIINNDLSGLLLLGETLAVGDINGDGYDDIIAGGLNFAGNVEGIVILGNGSFGSMNASALNLTTSTPNKGFRLRTDAAVAAAGNIAVGDINGDGVKDLIFSDMPSHAIVLYGQGPASLTPWTSCSCWSSPALDMGLPSFNNTYGFTIEDSTHGTYPFAQNPSPAGIQSIAVGDLNNDGIDDIALGSPTVNTNKGAVFVIFGRAFTNAAFESSCGTPPCKLDVSTQLDGTGTKGVNLSSNIAGDHLGNNVLISDFNGDGIKDLIASSNNNIYGLYGHAGTWADGTLPANFTINVSGSRPGFISNTCPTYLAVGDVNGDGLPDLLFGCSVTNPGTQQGYSGTRSNAGSVFVIYQPAGGFSGAGVFGATQSGNNFWFNSTTGNTNSGDSTYGFRIDGSGTGSYAFMPVVLDLNHDGKNDIGVAALGEGAIYTLYGRKVVPYDATTDLTRLQ